MDASGADFVPASLAGTIGKGSRVIVEGSIESGVLIAQRIESTN